MRRQPLELPLCIACMAYAGVVAAQPSASTGALAETLFRDGKALMAEGEYAKACPKLAESQRIDPGVGILLALAFCHEKEGKTATAWSEFVTAEGIAERANDVDRQRLARGYIERLEPKLVRVTIRVQPEMRRVEGFELRHNGVVLAPPTWGTTAPVDLGEHVLEATAPGRQSWTSRFVLREGDAAETVEVPALEPEAPATTPLPPPPLSLGTHDSHPFRTWGFAVGGLGLASVAVGAYFGVRAIGKNDDAKSLCTPTRCASADGIELNGQARSSATVSTVTITAGLAAVGVGTLLVLVSRSSAAKPRDAVLRLVPLVGASALGAGMGGAW
jgi:hypothetical protein